MLKLESLEQNSTTVSHSSQATDNDDHDEDDDNDDANDNKTVVMPLMIRNGEGR